MSGGPELAVVGRGLDAGYLRGRPVIRGLDLDLAAGQVTCLLGPNGAGKTTLLLTLAGLLPRLGGQLTVGGREVPSGRPREAVRAGLVLVPDDRALFRRLSTRQHLRLAAPGGRVAARTAIAEVLDHFPALRRRLEVPAGQLSGGEQQMLAIARALLQRPRALLVDELSIGLAPVVVEAILPVLQQVARDGGTAVLLVEQHVHLALEVADRALVLVHGEVRLADGAAALRADPDRVQRAYLGAG